jgi:hypothetical protein
MPCLHDIVERPDRIRQIVQDFFLLPEGLAHPDVFRTVYDELDAPPVAVSRVGCDADGIRRFFGCEAPLFGSH